MKPWVRPTIHSFTTGRHPLADLLEWAVAVVAVTGIGLAFLIAGYAS